MENPLIGSDITMVKDQIQEAKYIRFPIIGMSIMHKTMSMSAHKGKSKIRTGKMKKAYIIILYMTCPTTPNEPTNTFFNFFTTNTSFL